MVDFAILNLTTVITVFLYINALTSQRHDVYCTEQTGQTSTAVCLCLLALFSPTLHCGTAELQQAEAC
jgi:hypothetical protein